MSLDLRPEHVLIIQNILKLYVPHCRVMAFGSRVKGTAKESSDLDLCIIDSAQLSFEILAKLRDAFSLSILPYRVDIVDWRSIASAFQEIIKEHYEIIQEPPLF